MLMQLIDISFPTPEENLAYDDALLDYVEGNQSFAFLRFWRISQTSVVLGHGNKVASEVNIQACQQDNVPILRRQSGGGTILQGKGVLNYSLVLPISFHESLQSITATNTYIMNRMANALSELTSNISVNGITDIVIGDKKIVGNAQRRKRRSVLFHGCILVGLDLSLITRYLQHPSSEPDYRKTRSHDQFLTHLTYPEDMIMRVIAQEWLAESGNAPGLEKEVYNKTEEYYAQKSWNFKF